MRVKFYMACFVLVSILMAFLASSASARDVQQANPPTNPVVAQIYYTDRADLSQLAARLDVWEVKPEAGYLLALLTPEQYASLVQAGYRISIDSERTAQIYEPRIPVLGQGPDTIIGYPCYRTVEETYADMSALATAHPNLATWFAIGDSWAWVNSGGNAGYKINALRLTNKAISGSKPTFFLMAEIHAREYVTAETAARFAEYLVNNYGVDPDITWLLDYYQVYIVPMTNPDGRKLAEDAQLWRKNVDNNDGCNDPNNWGTDLNRNHTFMWNNGGSSGYPCDEVYHGPSAGSEPEVQAIQSLVSDLFPDQRGPGLTDPAPATTTGTFITLHSYSNLVLWPWGFTSDIAPNGTQLQTLGRKLAYFNGYTPQQSIGLYPTSGTSDDWAYGELGIASYTFEMGTAFFQDCNSFESTIYPTNRDALLMAFKSARRPYMEPSGPDALGVVASPGGVTPGDLVSVEATLNDTRFSGAEPTQNIAAAEYYVDTPPWLTNPTPIAHPMAAADGAFDEKVEDVVATLDTTGLGKGRHTIFVRGRDANGNWGVVSAAFLYVLDPAVAPTVQGFVRDANTNQPLSATVKAGMFLADTDPATGFYSMRVISGTYDLVTDADNHAPLTVSGVAAQNYQTVQHDFYLSPLCSILADDVESGNPSWTAQAPWAITTEAAHSLAHSWTESPGLPYSNMTDVSLTSPSLNLTNYTGIAFSFWHIYDIESGWDFGYVEYSTNDTTWTRAASYSGYAHTTWEQQTLQIPALDGQPNARIRFHFTSDGGVVRDGWHIDDINLVGGSAACSPPLAPTAAFTNTVSQANPGDPVQFIDLTYGTPPFTYQWDFGDGLGTSSEVDPVYAYPIPGLYTVTLTVTNALGSDSVSHEIYVQTGECVPLSDMSLSLLNPVPLRPADIAQFQADLLPAWVTRPISYTVDYGDGTSPVAGSSSADPLVFDHAFSLVGDYPVSISAWNCAMTVPITSSTLASVISYTVGLEVNPAAQAGSGDPGYPVAYTLTITNTGEQPDIFSLSTIAASWQTDLPAPLGLIPPGGSGNVVVSVAVAPAAAAGSSDTAVLRVASSHPDSTPVTATLTTTANLVYGLAIDPTDAGQAGTPGTTVTYTLHITNTGNATDTMNILVDSLWTTSLITTTGPLAGGAGIDIPVVVQVPVAAPDSSTDMATVTVTSQGDPMVWQVALLTTTARWQDSWLPVLLNSAALQK